jgi:hypothetical protein
VQNINFGCNLVLNHARRVKQGRKIVQSLLQPINRRPAPLIPDESAVGQLQLLLNPQPGILE